MTPARKRHHSWVLLLLVVALLWVLFHPGCASIQNPDVSHRTNRHSLVWFNYQINNTNFVAQVSSKPEPPLDSNRLRGTRLRLLLWRDYISPDLLAAVSDSHDVQFSVTFYDSNEELYERLTKDSEHYDLAMPSDFMVERLIDEDLLLPLDPTVRTALARVHLYPSDFAYDRGHQFSAPYQWGTTGIGYNADLVNPVPRSWASLFHPPREADWAKGRIGLLDQPREVFGAAFMYLGHSANAEDTNLLAQAAGLIEKEAGRGLFVFKSVDLDKALASGQLYMAHAWSGEVTKAAEVNPEIRFCLPDEGTILFVDNFVIPRNAENPLGATQLLLYLLQPTIAGENSNYSRYASTLLEAQPYIRREIMFGPSYMIPERTNNSPRYESALQGYYDAFWQKIKGAIERAAQKQTNRAAARLEHRAGVARARSATQE